MRLELVMNVTEIALPEGEQSLHLVMLVTENSVEIEKIKTVVHA